MIKTVRIENFRSHKESTLEFSPGVNVIIGETGAGKSTVKEAINKCLTNKPAGDEFRSHWGGDTKIIVEFPDDQVIIREVSDNNNSYSVFLRDGIPCNFLTGFGQGVPDEVGVLAQINDLNMQDQLDSPFLLLNTAGEVAKYFNKVVDLEVIDQSLFTASSQLKKASRELEFNSQELASLESELKNYEWLDSAENDFKDIEKAGEVVDCLENEIETIESLIEQYSELKKNEIKIDLKQAAIDLKNIQDLVDEIEDKEIELNNLENLILEFERYRENMKRCDMQISSIEQKIKKIMPEVCPLCQQKIMK